MDGDIQQAIFEKSLELLNRDGWTANSEELDILSGPRCAVLAIRQAAFDLQLNHAAAQSSFAMNTFADHIGGVQIPRWNDTHSEEDVKLAFKQLANGG